MPKITVPVPGMRNIKTSLAVFISLLACMLFRSEYPFYAAVASVICVQSEIEDSVKTGVNRLLGTFVGGGLGCLFLMAFKQVTHVLLFYVLVSIGVTMLIYFMNLIRWTSAISICCVVFLSVVIVHNTGEQSPLVFSLHRVLDTSIGVVIAIVIDWLLPSKPEKAPKNKIILWVHKKRQEKKDAKENPSVQPMEGRKDDVDIAVSTASAPESPVEEKEAVLPSKAEVETAPAVMKKENPPRQSMDSRKDNIDIAVSNASAPKPRVEEKDVILRSRADEESEDS